MEVFIVSATRSPIGAFQGALKDVAAPKIASYLVKPALLGSLESALVDECIMGQVLTAGTGQAPARQTALLGGLPEQVSCCTVNKVCGSGMKAIQMGYESLICGRNHWVLAGGQENMSLSPYLLMGAREGFKIGEQVLKDSLMLDGLTDAYQHFPMGTGAEECAKKFGISRESQDHFAIESYKKAQTALKTGAFKKEITAIPVKTKKETKDFLEDELPHFQVNFEKIPRLKPVFKKDGTVTPANASKIADGAALCLLASEDSLKKAPQLKPMASIVAWGSYSGPPEHFAWAPIKAIQQALKNARLKPQDIDLFEINEAFSVVSQAASQTVNIPGEKLNMCGGAVALGHPIGASGARIVVTLVHSLKRLNKQYGLASLCIGGGEALALIVKNVRSC